jgi:hypothetical protein
MNAALIKLRVACGSDHAGGVRMSDVDRRGWFAAIQGLDAAEKGRRAASGALPTRRSRVRRAVIRIGIPYAFGVGSSERTLGKSFVLVEAE